MLFTLLKSHVTGMELYSIMVKTTYYQNSEAKKQKTSSETQSDNNTTSINEFCPKIIHLKKKKYQSNMFLKIMLKLVLKLVVEDYGFNFKLKTVVHN